MAEKKIWFRDRKDTTPQISYSFKQIKCGPVVDNN